MAKRKSLRQTDASDGHDDVRRPRRVRRLMRRLVLLLLLLVGLVVAAPTIVSQAPLTNVLLGKIVPHGWQLKCQQASLGWMSHQTLSEVSLVDAEGKPLLQVESLKLAKPLLSLAMSQADLGKLELVRPVALVETRPDGSNWEDFLRALPMQEQTPSSKPVQLAVAVVEGAVRGVDQVTGQQWALDAANVDASIGDEMQVSGSAQLTADGSTQQGQVRFQWQPQEVGGHQLEVLAERVPLAPLEAWLTGRVPGLQLAGSVSTDARLRWHVNSQSGLQLETTGRLEASHLDVTADLLRGDRLSCQQISAPWKLKVVGEEVIVEQLKVDSDWAEFDASGSLKLDDLQSLKGTHPEKHRTELTGKIDLARLAQMLPNTMQLRDGVRIDAGELEFGVAGKYFGERLVWVAQAALQKVAGSDGRRQIRWVEPIQATTQLSVTPDGLQWDTVTVDAPFGRATYETEVDVTGGEFEINLAQLSQQLSQFVDLRPWQLRGIGEGKYEINFADQKFVVNAEMDLTDLDVAEGERSVWTEPKLSVGLFVMGQEQDLRPTVISMGKAKVIGPRDQLEVDLLEQVDLQVPKPTAKFKIVGNGPLQLWAGRLRPWIATIPQRVEGDAHVSAQVQVAADAVQVLESTGSIVQLRVQGDEFVIDEPRIEFSGDGAWNGKSRSVSARQLQLLGSSLSCRARDVAIDLSAQGAPTARGNVAFSADLERIAAMADLLGQPTSTWPRGMAEGQLQLSSSAEQLQADFGVKVQQLQLMRNTAANGAVYGKPEIVWNEPQLELTGVANYSPASDRLQLDNLRVLGQTLELNSSASLDQLRSAGHLKANGLVQYDPNALTKLLTSYTGPAVQLQGDRQLRFQVAGSLFGSDPTAQAHWSYHWDVTADAGWASAGVYGLPIGGGRLHGTLRDGQLQIAPLDVKVGQGRLTAQPLVRLIPGAEQLSLPRGPLVSNVAISPEVSEKMLKYVAPILAGATRAGGQFSIHLDAAEVPFGKPKQARVQGQLTTHRLAVSPGPMMNQLITVVKQIESLTKRKQFLQAATTPSNKTFLTMAERQVDFQVVEGRVYHRNLEFLIDDVPVRSRGSVGFDQTLALEIEVPIQDKWIESEPALRGFAGQSLRLPIYGTFQRPRIDERAVADLSRQLLQGAATQAIGDELNRQFEKLFGR